LDYNLWQQLILGATKPFRTGANILAQNWGSALTGKDMSQRENQGQFLKWLAGSLDPEEQQTITQKPYLSSLKSSAGMASTLAPFASQGLRTAQLAANPLTNRIAQLASQGALEGSLGGFGLSREGKEVQDTLTGGLTGAGGELFMDYLTNPQFRNMLTDATTTINPQTGARMYKGELGNNTVDPLKNEPKTTKVWIKSKFSDEGAYSDVPVIRKEENITLYQGGKPGDGRQFWTPDKKYAEQFGDVREKTGAFYKIDNGNRVADVYVEVPNTVVDPLDTLKQEAKKYATPEEFVEATAGKSTYSSKSADITRGTLQKYNPLKDEMFVEPKIKDNKILVFRATTNKGLIPGDFIATHENTAKGFLKTSGDNAKVVSEWVPIEDVYTTQNGYQVYKPGGKTLLDIWNEAHNLKDSAKELRGGFKEILKKSGLR